MNRLFTERTLDALASHGYDPVYEHAARKYASHCKGMTNREVLRAVFEYMQKHYRNEYIFKSLLLNKLVFGVHNPRTSTAICELPIAGSIADFVIVNGRAVVYEIKTDLDNFQRLDKQINNYYKAFEYVNILCSEATCGRLLSFFAGSPVGICVLTKRGGISVRKESLQYTAEINRAVQYDLLRKAERNRILLNCGFELPDVGASRYYQTCFNLFNSIPDCQFSGEFLRALKSRGDKINIEALNSYPHEFRLIAYTHRATIKQATALNAFLEAPCFIV